MPDRAPLAVVLGCSGERLSAFERDLFAAAGPAGFILFGRNCSSPEQVRELVGSLRGCVGREDAPVLIDQEGGRVARLRPPHWRKAPPARLLGELYARDPERGLEAALLNSRLLAADVASIGGRWPPCPYGPPIEPVFIRITSGRCRRR